jgi:hypothetical protein
MALTREFKDTVKARAARNPDFREKLLIEASQQLLAGDLETEKSALRDYINATVGFETVSKDGRWLGLACGRPSRRRCVDIVGGISRRGNVT